MRPKETTVKDLIKRLVEYREHHGYTQAELANELDVWPGTISRWISAGGTPSPESAGRIMVLLGEDSKPQDFEFLVRLSVPGAGTWTRTKNYLQLTLEAALPSNAPLVAAVPPSQVARVSDVGAALRASIREEVQAALAGITLRVGADA